MNRKLTVLFFLLILPSFVLAGTVGKIQGKVTDLQSGEPLIGANILVVGSSSGAATDVNGEYTIQNLNAGVYQLKASFIGYQAITVSNVRVNADLTTEINFQLPAEGVTIGEVNVIAERPLINKSNTNAIRVTTNEQIQALPVRGINNLISLVPGVVVQDNKVYIRGGRNDEVGYYLEGTNITNAVTGTRQVSIPQNALEEIQVQAGGYTAEFGGANGGIIRTQLKSGGAEFKATAEYITDNISLKNKAGLYDGKEVLGAYSYGYNDFSASVSGPLLGNNIKFYGIFENLSQADPNPQPYPGIHLGKITDPNTNDTIDFNYNAGPALRQNDNQYNGAATLTFDYNPIIVRLYGTYAARQYYGDTYYANTTSTNILNMLDLNRIPVTHQNNGTVNLKITHVLSPSTFYEVSGGFVFNQGHTWDPYLKDNYVGYGDSVANTEAGAPWYRRPSEGNRYGRFTVPSVLAVFQGFTFNAPNTPISEYSKFKNQNINITAALSSQVNKENALKFGGDVQMMTFSKFAMSNALTLLLANRVNSGDDLARTIMLNGINNYGYDVLGDPYTGSTSNYDAGQIAPKKPIFAGVYLEDRLEYQNLIVNAGLRYDYINTDNTVMVDPTHPELSFDKNTHLIIPGGWTKAPSFSGLSPRLGFSFPVTDQTVFHAQYGKFIQQTRLNDIYKSEYAWSYQVARPGNFYTTSVAGLNVRPIRTTQYEVGFTQQLGEFASFDLTGYYKDISGQVVYNQLYVDKSSGFLDYTALTNGDFATTKGIEVSFNMRRTSRIMVNGSASFESAEGTNSNPFANAGLVGSPLDPNYVYKPNNIQPLAFNRALSGNLSIDYRFGIDDGPSVLHQFGASLLLTFASGHPFTLGYGSGVAGNLEGFNAGRFRLASEPLGSSTTPANFQLDLSVDKSFLIMDKLNATIFVNVINLLNTKNYINVFTRTGSATDDGYLTSPEGRQLTESYGQDFVDLYKAINLDYGDGYSVATGNLLYGPPRQIRVGVRLEY